MGQVTTSAEQHATQENANPFQGVLVPIDPTFFFPSLILINPTNFFLEKNKIRPLPKVFKLYILNSFIVVLKRKRGRPRKNKKERNENGCCLKQ
jgi:hypothetical protein